MSRRSFFGLLVIAIVHVGAWIGQAAGAIIPPGAPAIHLRDVRLRDPYIWPDVQTKIYYLISSTDWRGPNGRPAVVAFASEDLTNWYGPNTLFAIPKNFWAQRAIWAPQMFLYRCKFFLFLTFDSGHLLPDQIPDWPPRVERGSQILFSDSPLGAFKPFGNQPALGTNLMTLDGTLWIEKGVPYMVFSHEWVQAGNGDGEIEAVRLKKDLSSIGGTPRVLFHGSDASWSRGLPDYDCRVTDAPWLYRTKNGKLLMLWSSFCSTGYAVGLAVSRSGELKGPWTQGARPFFSEDGGHPSIFKSFDGRLMMILHQPNEKPNERARILQITDTGDTVHLAD